MDALQLALRGLGIGPGDEVIVPSHTYIASWLAVSATGATPVPVEPHEDHPTLDPLLVEKAITPRTRALLPVHLYGHPADLDALRDLAARHGLHIVEDAAQAHGARYRGRMDRRRVVGGRVQLLPGQEPRLLRRRRRRRHRRPRARRTAADAPQLRLPAEVQPRDEGHQLPPGRDAGGRPADPPRPPGRLERPQVGAGRGVPVRARRTPRRHPAGDRTRHRPGLAPLHRAHGPPRRPAGPPGRPRHRHAHALPGAGAPLPPTRATPRRRARCRAPRASRGRSSACRSARTWSASRRCG